MFGVSDLPRGGSWYAMFVLSGTLASLTILCSGSWSTKLGRLRSTTWDTWEKSLWCSGPWSTLLRHFTYSFWLFIYMFPFLSLGATWSWAKIMETEGRYKPKLTQKRQRKDNFQFPLSAKRLLGDQKRIFEHPKVTEEWLWGLKESLWGHFWVSLKTITKISF